MFPTGIELYIEEIYGSRGRQFRLKHLISTSYKLFSRLWAGDGPLGDQSDEGRSKRRRRAGRGGRDGAVEEAPDLLDTDTVGKNNSGDRSPRQASMTSPDGRVMRRAVVAATRVLFGSLFWREEVLLRWTG